MYLRMEGFSLMTYYDQDGNAYFVAMIAATDTDIRWGTVRLVSELFMERVTSRFLPLRRSERIAQLDLKAYARRKQWEEKTDG
jgi:hypothetical protein